MEEVTPKLAKNHKLHSFTDIDPGDIVFTPLPPHKITERGHIVIPPYYLRRNPVDIPGMIRLLPSSIPLDFVGGRKEKWERENDDPVDLVMEQTSCTREVALNALHEKEGDIVAAIMMICANST